MAQTIPSKATRKPPQADGDSEYWARDITQLPALEVAALRAKWQELFGAEPSPRLGRPLMIRAIAHRLQERALGGLKPATQRLLGRVCDGRGEAALDHSSKPRPGGRYGAHPRVARRCSSGQRARR
jgi:hypothetical protein